LATLDHAALSAFVEKMWADEITPTLVDYIRIPNKSPMFEPDWEKLGHMEKAVQMFANWAREKIKALPGTKLEILRAPGRTPLIVIDSPGKMSGETVLLYGHLDKQPEMTGWAPGKGPWIPVIEGDKLYGRGGADDGYAIFGAVTALLALEEQGIARARSVIIIEASEESGSPDLPHYMDMLAKKIGDVGLVVCLDSGCGDYDRLWLTTSLRGLIGGTLKIDVLEEGVHSGDASGVVPSSFRILRMLLDRIDDVTTGEVKPHAFRAVVPDDRRAQAKIAADALGDAVYSKFPFVDGMTPATDDNVELILNRTWRAALSVTGFDGAPPPSGAGNVLRPFTTAKLSLRLPPTTDADRASAELKRLLENEPPYGAKVSFKPEQPGSGWNAPPTDDWLAKAFDNASEAAWGNRAAMMGEGGSIPFMGMLGKVFPKAQFAITGVLGPHSNAHGPNEFLHLPTGRRVTETVAHVLVAHANEKGRPQKNANGFFGLFKSK